MLFIMLNVKHYIAIAICIYNVGAFSTLVLEDFNMLEVDRDFYNSRHYRRKKKTL